NTFIAGNLHAPERSQRLRTTLRNKAQEQGRGIGALRQRVRRRKGHEEKGEPGRFAHVRSIDCRALALKVRFGWQQSGIASTWDARQRTRQMTASDHDSPFRCAGASAALRHATGSKPPRL